MSTCDNILMFKSVLKIIVLGVQDYRSFDLLS